MGIPVSAGFDVGTNLPLDSRLVKADVTARNTIVAGSRYEGMPVFVVATQKNYQLRGGIADGNWVELVDAGSSGEPALGNPPITGYVLSSTVAGARSWIAQNQGMMYPSAGIPNSTGSAWTTSYTVTGTGTVVALQASPSFTGTVAINSGASAITARFISTYYNRGIKFGVDSGSEPSIQAIVEGTSAARQLSINPEGGNVVIGTTAPYGSLNSILTVNQSSNGHVTAIVVNSNAGSSARSTLALSTYGDTWSWSAGSYANNLNALNLIKGDAGTDIKMTILASGSVGIGTTSPNTLLHINGALSSSTPVNILTLSRPYQAGVSYSSLFSIALSNQNGSNNTRVDFNLLQTSSGGLPAPDITVMSIYSDGHTTFIGTTSATNFIIPSDERLKKNISRLVPSPVNLEYFQFELKSEPGQIRYGFIAQRVQRHYPEFVREDAGGILSLSYTDIMLRKIAYLEWKVEQLEKKIK